MAESLPFETDDETDAAAGAVSVLVVDDEFIVRDVFARLLGRETDLSVVTSDTAENALDLLHERKYDLLITDKNLPGRGGVELIGAARIVQPAIEAIMITGYATAESLLAALAAGATDYITKPFDDLKVVRAKIRAALERRDQAVKDRRHAFEVAKEASAMLGKGKVVSDAVWDALDRAIAAYELAIKEGGAGQVLVIGKPETARALAMQRLSVLHAQALGPEVDGADVVVLETSIPEWGVVAEMLAKGSADVIVLAGGDAGLEELLEALALHLDLVGFGSPPQAAAATLPAKVKGLLLRRAVQAAQVGLAAALEAFRAEVKSAK